MGPRRLSAVPTLSGLAYVTDGPRGHGGSTPCIHFNARAAFAHPTGSG
jgi:hypothetical protein